MTILRTYARLVVPDLDGSVPLFEALAGEHALRFPYGEMQVAIVGDFLLVELPARTTPERVIQAVCAVDDLEGTLRVLDEHGAQRLSGPKEVPTGRNVVAQHADGLVVEYVQLRPELAARLLPAQSRG